MVALVLAVFGVLLSSALCSGSEAALFSVSLVKARALADEGDAKGRALLQIREAMERPIAAIVILNNVANIVGSIIVGRLAAGVLGDAWLGLFSGVLTFMVIIFSEIVPKTVGERHADTIAPDLGAFGNTPLDLPIGGAPATPPQIVLRSPDLYVDWSSQAQ